MQLNIKMVVMF